jgi:1-acyl-sn-glycerol-3-phosphate acyltransferase
MALLAGIFYYVAFFMFTFLYNILCELLCLVNIIFYKLVGEFNIGELKYHYAHYYLLVLELLGVNIYINNDISKDRVLWISNHRSKLDGLILQSVLCANGTNVISVVKKSVAYIPIVGSFGKHTNCIFIQRTKAMAEKVLAYHSRKSWANNWSILIFPEGTTMSPSCKQQSDKYARENNLPMLNNILLPRTIGFDIIKTEGKFDLVGNITIRYTDPEIAHNNAHSYIDLLRTFPKKIYIDISYHDASTTNLHKLYEDKDKHLGNKVFYNNYELFDDYSYFWMCMNFIMFIIFYLNFFKFPIFCYATIGITIYSMIKSYVVKYDQD